MTVMVYLLGPLLTVIEAVVRGALRNVGHGGAYMVRASAVKALREAGSR